MAKNAYSNAWKNCATCAHWQGERELNEKKTEVLVTGSSVGVCEGFWQGSRKYPNDKCPQWEKWPDLGTWSGEVRATYP